MVRAMLPTMRADTLIADKAFDADERVLEPLAAAGKTAAIPAKAASSLASSTSICTRPAV